LGGTLIKGALVGSSGRVESRVTVPTGAAEGHLAVVERLVEVGRELVQSMERSGAGRPAALGVAVPGLVDMATGVALKAANIDWVDYSVGAVLAERIGLPVAITHDVAAAAVAEHRFGAARGAEVAVVAAIGTGIAAAVVSRGELILGAHGRIVELGHLPLAWSDEPCGCGGAGCVERVASASALSRRYAAGGGGGPGPAGLTAVDGPAAPLDAKAVIELAARGDQVAGRVWRDAILALAEALAAVVTILDPDRIVIGGGLSGAGETLLAPLRVRLAERLTFQAVPAVVGAELGSDAGVAGAAIAAQQRSLALASSAILPKGPSQ
jgi:glucokinase